MPNKQHYLHRAKRTTIPQTIICADSESYFEQVDDKEIHTLRLWYATTLKLNNTNEVIYIRSQTYGYNAISFANFVVDMSKTTKELFVFFHNAHFDISVLDMFEAMKVAGAKLETWNLTDGSNFIKWKYHNNTILVCDSTTFCPNSLADLARDVSKRKKKLPDNLDGNELWLERCKIDTEILADIVEIIVKWFHKEQLGRFGVTGAASGWSALKTKMRPFSVMVGQVPNRTSFERNTIYGGRKEAFKVGIFTSSLIADYDFQNAYPRIMACKPLPTRCIGSFPRMSIDKFLSLPADTGIIANCIIETITPNIPCRVDDSVFYGVGRFKSNLTSVEIKHALDTGAKVEILNGYKYELTYALRDFALYMLDILASPDEQVHRIVKRMVKSWSRSVTGKFAQHRSQIIDRIPSIDQDWTIKTGFIIPQKTHYQSLVIDGMEVIQAQDLDGVDASPCILAYIEAYCRVDLDITINSYEPANVLTCNTDGFLFHHAPRSSRIVPWTVNPPHTLVRKELINEIEIIGADYIKLPNKRKIASIPSSAVEVDKLVFEWHDWPTLSEQLHYGQHGQFIRNTRRSQLPPSITKRWTLATGETIPVTLEIKDNDYNDILPWSKTKGRKYKDYLANVQINNLHVKRDEIVPNTYEDSDSINNDLGRYPHRYHVKIDSIDVF